ncbi:hypothetical protein [Spirillospora sp. NPDC029432]|uniref:hypothetical protein n=1 Tax=Spirillospora sp. NPDC029432 TaxID=3154599 RepID=UPI003453511C
MAKIPAAFFAATVLVAGLGMTACGESRHCEHDATDRVVADSYCEKNTPGYEWESDSGKSKKRKKR